MRTASKTKHGVLALALAGLLMAFTGVVAVPGALTVAAVASSQNSPSFAVFVGPDFTTTAGVGAFFFSPEAG